jgi:DNA-binding NarL/FixJ family response regulator
MKILIVDDHVLLREGLASLLEKHPDFEVIGQAGSVNEAVEKAICLIPDIVLMDISLPDGSGLQATKAILSQRPDIAIVMLTVHETDELLFEAVRAGAKGYLLKNTSTTHLYEALKAVYRGEAALSGIMTRSLLDEFSRGGKGAEPNYEAIKSLTPRETEILSLLTTNATNREIADHLVISERTVKVHVHNILDKLQLKSRREAARLAKYQGLIVTPSELKASRA